MFDRPSSLRGLPVSICCGLTCAALFGAFFPAFLAAQNPGDTELIAQALEYYRTGKCKEAEPLFEKILLHQPKNTAVRKLLAHCLVRDNKMEEARTQFQQVLDDSPQDMEAFAGLRSATTELQGREELRQTLAIESRAVTAEQLRASHEFRQAETLIRAGRLTEAEKILEGIVSREPDSVRARQRLAEIYTRTRRFAMAAEIYRSLAERPRASSIFLLRLAQNLEWDGNMQAAASGYRRYLERNPRDEAARLALANLFMWNGHYLEAARYYRQYLAAKPDDAAVRLNLAQALIWSKHYREAIPELQRLQVQTPRDVKVHLALAQCYQQLSEMEPALRAFEKVLELDPANPAALEARAYYLHILDELPRQKAYAAMERNDFDSAAKLWGQYLEKHPDSNETVLRIARVHSWAKQYPEAKKYYEEYLKRAPLDFGVQRELARLAMWNQDYTAARQYLAQLVQSPAATSEDYESLVHAYLWTGDLAGAQPFARKLAELDPSNPVASQTLHDYAEQERLMALRHAEGLASSGRYAEAIVAYHRYMATYGEDKQIELLIARLYGWGKDYSQAIAAYRQFLGQYPHDIGAQMELANIENWSGQYDAAEADYRTALRSDPHNLEALMGLAQVRDYRGDDPFRVRESFREVIAADPRNTVAQRRLEEIHPLVAPALGYSESSFWDTDRFYRSVNSIEATFPLPGRIKLTPFYTLGYFQQKFENLRFHILGDGGGARLEISRSARWSLLGELGVFHFNALRAINISAIPVGSGRSSLNARTFFSFRPGGKGNLNLTYVHRDAVYDLNTFRSLVGGIMGDTILISYERPLAERVRFWVAGGLSHYSHGILSTPDFKSNTQPRLSARVDYLARPWFRLGYSGRATGFESRAPLYFSPWRYQTHGLAYALNHRISKNLRANADGEVDYGRITTNPGLAGITAQTFELSVAPVLSWQVRRDMELRLGYRFSRGRGSSLGSPVAIYRTQGIELVLRKVF